MTYAEIEKFFQDEYVDYYRVSENERFKFFFWARNFEGEIVPVNVILKDKTIPDTYYILKHYGVWDMVYDQKNNSLLVGIRYSINRKEFGKQDQEIERLAKNLNISLIDFNKHYWEANNMCGDCPTTTMLGKINLNDFSLTTTKIFGGEEIKLFENKLFITQYTSDKKTYSCWIKIEPHDKEECDQLNIKVQEIHPATLELITENEFLVKKIGQINNVHDSFKSWNDGKLINAIKENL